VISFIVPAYNEERYLGATLAAIHAAAAELAEPYEIVVADDASSDATADVAAQGGARVVRVEKRQIAGTRNAGARAATGEHLVFVDADTRVNASLVAEALAAMRGGAVGGGARVRMDPSPFWASAFMAVFNPIYFGLARLAAGCFVFCTRAAFEAAGGFDETYYAGEEMMFSNALKRLGRFVILRSFVVSSSRKLDHHTPGEMFWMFAKLALSGPAALRKRGPRTAFWYPDKR
jgi:glycosyltransferase involved in cell wall biosynthesis